MSEEISPISHLEKVIAGQESPISHLEQIIALHGTELNNKIEALKTSQSLEYEGTDVTCENTLTSRTSDIVVKGQTYKNLDTGGIESAGEKENKISILSKSKNLINEEMIQQGNLSGTDNNLGQEYPTPNYFKRTNYIPLEKNTNYILSLKNIGLYKIEKIIYYNSKNTVGVRSVVIDGTIAHIKTENNEKYIRICFSKADTTILPNNVLIQQQGLQLVQKINKKEILLPIEGGLKSLPNGVCDTIEQRTDGVYLTQRVKKETYVNGDENNNNYLTDKVNTYKPLETPTETKLDINNLGLEVYEGTTYITTDNAIQPVLSFKVSSNIGGIMQTNAQNINKLYKLIDEVIIPQLINNSADIEILKLK